MADIIWNGLGLTTPEGWEPAGIERDGLTLAYMDRPVCELKWNRVAGSFSFDKHIKRLTKGHKGAALSGVDESETPPVWIEALQGLAESGIRAKSFIWKTDVSRGIGAALHNPGTGLAVLVQFFIGQEGDETVAAETLATLRDYTAGQTSPWSMFGITARIPAEFTLNTFSFKPGHYQIRYWRPRTGKQQGRMPPGKGPGTHLIFERFAPASVLLKNVDLESWIHENVEDVPDGVTLTRGTGVEWDATTKTSLLRKALRRQQFSSGRAWTTDTGNAILSVIAHGTVPAPEKIFTEICESYTLVQEETN